MEDALHERVIGQEEAIATVSKAVRRARAGLKDPEAAHRLVHLPRPDRRRKTELAKALAEFMFGCEDALIKIDMSEFMERHTVSRAGRRASRLRRLRRGRPADRGGPPQELLVILLDEIEKAHPEVFNMLLQIMEDGHLTDAKGRRVDFRNTIIIMTSQRRRRADPDELEPRLPDHGRHEAARAREPYDQMKDKVAAELKQTFRPEFLNRIDATVVFRSLTTRRSARSST